MWITALFDASHLTSTHLNTKYHGGEQLVLLFTVVGKIEIPEASGKNPGILLKLSKDPKLYKSDINYNMSSSPAP